MSYTRAMDCRYCQRYNRACGRDHTAETQGDWSRDWQGNTDDNLGDIQAATDTGFRAAYGVTASEYLS